MSKAALLYDLRKQTGSLALNDKDLLSAPHFSSGVAVGCVAELLGNARIDWLIDFFKMHPESFIFWCKSEAQINPQALLQRGINLDRIKFVNAAADTQQILRIAFESQLYPFIVAPNRFDEIKIFQRLSLLAEKSKSILFLLAQKNFSQAWPIALQLEINNGDQTQYDIFVHKQKHGLNE